MAEASLSVTGTKTAALLAFVNGARESDYFGFGEFTVTDAYGAKT